MDFRSKLQKITSIESLDLEALKNYNSFRNEYIDFLHNRLSKDDIVSCFTEFMQLADFIYSKLDTNSVIPLTKSHFIEYGVLLYNYIYNYNLIAIQNLSEDELKSNSLFQALKSTILNSVEPYTKEIFCIYDEHLYKDSYIENCYKPNFIDSDSIKHNNYEELYFSFEKFSLLIETLESIEDAINKDQFDDTMVIPEEIIDSHSILIAYLIKYYNRCLVSSSTNVDGIWLASKTHKMIRSLVKNFFYLFFDSYLSVLSNDAYHIRHMIYDFAPFICSKFDQYKISYEVSYYLDLKKFLYEILLEKLTPLLAPCSSDPKLTYAIIDVVKTTNDFFKEDITSFKNFDIFSLTLLIDIYPQDMHIPLIFVFIIQSYINILKQSLSTDSVCIALNKTTLEDITKKVNEIFNLNYIYSLSIESTYLQKTDFFQALLYHMENSIHSRFKIDRYQIEDRTYKVTNNNGIEILSQLINDITSIQNDRILFLKRLFDNYDLVDFEFLNGTAYIYNDNNYNSLKILSDGIELEDLNIDSIIKDLLCLYEEKNAYSHQLLFKRKDHNLLCSYISQHDWLTSDDGIEFDDPNNKFYSLSEFLLSFKEYEIIYRDNITPIVEFLTDFKTQYNLFIENGIDDESYRSYLTSYSNLNTITFTPNRYWCYCYKHPFTKDRFAIQQVSSGYKITHTPYIIIELKDERAYSIIEEELESNLILLAQDNSIEIFNFMSQLDDEGYTKSCSLIKRTIDDYQVLSPIVDTDSYHYVDFYTWWFINNLLKSSHNSSKKLVYREADDIGIVKFEDFSIDNFYTIDRVNDLFNPILRYDSSSIKSLDKLPIDGHMIWKCNSKVVDLIEKLKSKSIDFILPHRKSLWYSLSNMQPPSYNKAEDFIPYCCFIRWLEDTDNFYFFKEDNLDIRSDLLKDASHNSDKIIGRFVAYNDFDFFENILYDHRESSYNPIEVDYDEDLKVIRFPRKSENAMGYYLDLKEEDDRFIVLDAIDSTYRNDIYDYSDYYKIYSESGFKFIESSLSEGKTIIIIKPFSFVDKEFDLSRVVVGESNITNRLKLKYISSLNREFDRKILTKENMHKISTYNLLDGWLKSKDIHITDKNQDEVVLDILNNSEFDINMISKLQIFLQTKNSLEILTDRLNLLMECKDRIENASSEEEMKIIYSHFKIELETKLKG